MLLIAGPRSCCTAWGSQSRGSLASDGLKSRATRPRPWTMTRVFKDGLVIFGLATAMHLDWHAARPAEHHLSLGWTWHWLLGVPVGVLTAWYGARAWAARPAMGSIVIFVLASVLAGIVEPYWELRTGATFDWAFGPERLSTFAAFLVTTVIAHVTVLRLVIRPPAGSVGPPSNGTRR